MADSNVVDLVLRCSPQGFELFDQAGKKVGEFGRQAEEAGKRAEGGFSKFAANILTVNNALDLLGKASRAASAAVDGVFGGIDRGAQLNDLSQRLGVSVETLSKLELAAKTSGVSLDGLGTGIQQLSRNMVEAASGGKEAQAAFAALGISARDLKSLNTEQVLGKIANAFAGSEDGATKTALAMQLLGRSGAQLIPLLNEGEQGLARFADISQRLGLTLSGDTAKAMDSIGDSIDILKSAVTGVQNQLAIGLAPALEHVTNKMVDAVADFGIGEGAVRDFGVQLGLLIQEGVEPVIEAIERLSDRARDIGLGPALVEELSNAKSAASGMAHDLGIALGAAVAEGVKSGFRVDWSDLLGNIPVVGIAQKIGAALKNVGAEHFPPEVRAAIDEYNAAILRTEAAEAALAQSSATAAARSSDAGEAYTLAGGKIGIYGAAAQQVAEKLGLISTATGDTHRKTLDLSGAQGAAAKAAEELAKAYGQQVSTLIGSIEATEDQNDALQEIIDGNLSAADAQEVLNDAAEQAAFNSARNAGFNEAEAQTIAELTRHLNEEAQALRARNAINAQRLEVNSLQAQIPLMQQAISGAITRADAEHEIAVILEKQKLAQEGVTEGVDELAKKTVDARDEFAKVSDQFHKLRESGVDAWKGIDQAFDQTLDGLINGTLEMADVWRSFTLGLLKDFASSMGGVSGILSKVVSGVQGLADGSGSAGSFIESLGGGTARFQDKLGNTDYGAVAGAAVQGGATAYSLFQATDDTKLEGLIAKGTESGVINASNSLGQVVGAIAGAVLSIYLGPLGGIVGAAVGSALAGLVAGSVDRETFLTGDYKGFVGFQQVFDPFHAWLTDLVLNLPTLGLAMRKGAEAVLDESKTFAGLQSKLGDITVRSGGPEDVYRNNLTGSDTARARGFTQGQVDLTEGATAAIFGQIAGGELPEDAGRLGEAMGRIMAEFLSRGLEEGVDFEPMFDKLREFAHEAGIDLFSSMRALGDVMTQSIAAATTWGHLDPMAAATQGARAYAEALVGATAVFEGDFPAGVNLTAIALRNFEKDGVNAFANLDDQAKDTLLNLTTDTESTMAIVQKLVEQGFTIDVEQFESQVRAIAGSASFIGQNIGDVFTGPSVFAGIDALGEKLKQAIRTDVLSKATEQLFDKTRIAESFAPVYEVLGKLKDGEFDLTDAVGAESFKNQMVEAIAAGKASLQDYIPQIRAIRDAADEVDKAIEEALKPTEAEAFWENLSETFEANKDAIAEMAEGMFDVAVQAERAGAGLGQQATREAMSAQVDQGIYSATQAAVSTAAGESPEAQRLAALTTEFQFKVQAALKDGVVSGAELADLTALKKKMHEAGEQVADGISAGAAALDPLFRADRRKEAQDAATASLKDTVGTSAGSMFDVIKGGGSVDEGVKAFGESFRSSVRDNVLQGMQEALVQSVIMEGALGGLMGDLKHAVSVAMEDGMIDANEQAFIDGLAKGIGQATDNAITQLEPTVRALGGVAETVVGNSEKAEAKVGDLNESTKNASYGVDEMARRAAKNLEGVGDAVPSEATDAIKTGLGALKDAVGEAGSGPAAQIGAGIGALKDAIGGAGGGPAAEIGAGVGALKDALGGAAGGGAAQIGAGVGALKDALADGVITPIEAGILKLQGAVGSTGVTDDIAAGMNALAGAVGASTSGVPDDIKAGLTALHDAVGTPTNGPAAGISAGLGALKDAIGTDTSGTAAEIGAGLGLLRGAFGVEGTGSGLSAAVSGAIDAFGSTGNGVVGAADAVREAFNGANGAVSAADTIASKLRDDLAPAADDLTSALQDGFKIGLGEAETAARNLATALSSVGGIPGRANGGPVPAGTMAFVGERGPELILAHPGGGVSVVPLDNVPGYAGGTGDIIPIHTRGGGRPHVPPPPGVHPPSKNPDADGEDVTISVSFSFDSAIDAFMKTGDPEALHDSVMKSVGEGILAGMKQGLMMEIGLDDFQKKLAKAIEDGASEAEFIAMGEDFAKTAEDAITKAGPAFDAVAEAFGLGLQEKIDEIELDPTSFSAALDGLGATFTVLKDGVEQNLSDALREAAQKAAPQVGEMVGGSLKGLLNDPANLNFEAFSQSLRQSIFQNVAGGLIDAFIESAVTQGALAPMLGAISLIFDQIGQKQLTIAEANALIAEQMAAINNVLLDPTFKASIEQLINGVSAIGKDLNAFAPAATAAASAASGVSDAVNTAREDVCDGQCELTKEVIDMGAATLDEMGRRGYETVESWQGGPHGPDPTADSFDINDTLGGDPNGQYGWLGSDADWRRHNRWDRRERQYLRNHPIQPGQDPDDIPFFGPGYVPAFAAGGIVRRPTVALVGEAGPEIIIPLDALSGAMGGMDHGVDPAVMDALNAARRDIEALKFSQLPRGEQGVIYGTGFSAGLEALEGDLALQTPSSSSSRDRDVPPPPPSAPAGIAGGDAETTQLLREIAEHLRAGRNTGNTGEDAKFNKLADAIAGQPILVEGKVSIDGTELVKSTFRAARRMSRGGQSVTHGVN